MTTEPTLDEQIAAVRAAVWCCEDNRGIQPCCPSPEQVLALRTAIDSLDRCAKTDDAVVGCFEFTDIF